MPHHRNDNAFMLANYRLFMIYLSDIAKNTLMKKNTDIRKK